MRAAREHGIRVARVPAYSPHAVAEYAVTLMQTLNRKPKESQRKGGLRPTRCRGQAALLGDSRTSTITCWGLHKAL